MTPILFHPEIEPAWKGSYGGKSDLNTNKTSSPIRK